MQLYVIAAQLGVPRSEFRRFRQWSDAWLVGLGLPVPEEVHLDAAETYRDLGFSITCCTIRTFAGTNPCSEFADEDHEALAADDGNDHVSGLRATAWALLTDGLTKENVAFHRNCSGKWASGRRSRRGSSPSTTRSNAGSNTVSWPPSATALATVLVSTMLSNPINRAMMGDPQFVSEHSAALYFSQNWAIFLSMI